MLSSLWLSLTLAQVAPSANEMSSYQGLLAAVAEGNSGQVQTLIAQGADLEQRDSNERTPVLVAAHLSFDEVARDL